MALEIADLVIGFPAAEVGPIVVNQQKTANHFLDLTLLDKGRQRLDGALRLAYVGFHAAGARENATTPAGFVRPSCFHGNPDELTSEDKMMRGMMSVAWAILAMVSLGGRAG